MSLILHRCASHVTVALLDTCRDMPYSSALIKTNHFLEAVQHYTRWLPVVAIGHNLSGWIMVSDPDEHMLLHLLHTKNVVLIYIYIKLVI